MEFLKSAPFNLDEKALEWVQETYVGMSTEEKLQQLFCPIVFMNEEEALKGFVKNMKPGGILYREGKAEDIAKNHRLLQENSDIPLLIASNLEKGGNGAVHEGTFYGSPMLAAAAGDDERGYQLGKIACSEGAAVGVNWSFAPIVDLDRNFRNPITNIRTFGDDPEKVITMASAYIRAAKEVKVAACAKHFPGDGIDERDQHLLTSVNNLSQLEWDDSYGRIYKSMIDNQVLTIMAGHIALPAYEADGQLNVPATLSKALLQDLLRGQLGFNGLITTDATPMIGFCGAMERRKAVPYSIEAGCDMFLFNRDLEEDFNYMREGYEQGILSEKRLEEAVLRILGTKAALSLHEKQATGQLVPDESAREILGNEAHVAMAMDCADKGVTLVKDTQALIPISSTKYPRILLQILGESPSNDQVFEDFNKRLVQEGFQVTRYVQEDFRTLEPKVEVFKSQYDLVLYIANVETASNKTVSRINWFTFFGLGNNIPWFVEEVPTLMVSVGNPYHLFDAPMIKTMINGYCSSSYVIDAVIEKVMGRSRFKGVSPIDPFCGREDTKL